MEPFPPEENPAKPDLTDEVTEPLLARVLAGEATSAEEQALRQWLAERGITARHDRTLQARVEDLPPVAGLDMATSWAAMQARLQRSGEENRKPAASPNLRTVVPGARWSLRHRVVAVSAAMALATIGVLAGIYTRGMNVVGPHAHDGTTRVYTTAAGQQATVTLADGSRVQLGPATTLSVQTDPSHAHLDVHVTGQALFTVTHRPEKTFRIQAGHAIASVLGTTFLVRRYTTDRVTRVVVTDGRVSLRGMHGNAVIGATQVLAGCTLGVVDDSGQVRITPNIVVEEYTGWASGQLVFHRTPVRDIVMELGRAYGVEIRVTDSALATRALTWTVPIAQQSLTGVLGALAEVLDAHTVRTGQVITLVPGGGSSQRPGQFQSTFTSERQYGR